MFERLIRGARKDDGQGFIAVIVSIVVFVIAAFLLYQTVAVSLSINKKAGSIQENAVSINGSASSIARLVQTEKTLDSILTTSKPLVPSLDQIIAVGKTIDGQAVSINGSIQAIGASTRGIGGQISSITSTAKTIAGDITRINNLLDQTTGIGRQIKGDSVPIEDSLHSAEVSTCNIGIAGLVIPARTCQSAAR
jgi:hypothetical protein